MKVIIEHRSEGGEELSFGKRWDHAWWFKESKGDNCGPGETGWESTKRLFQRGDLRADGVEHWVNFGFYAEWDGKTIGGFWA